MSAQPTQQDEVVEIQGVAEFQFPKEVKAWIMDISELASELKTGDYWRMDAALHRGLDFGHENDDDFMNRVRSRSKFEDRLALYFKIADTANSPERINPNWAYPTFSVYDRESGKTVWENSPQLKERLAHTAFAMLAKHVFSKSLEAPRPWNNGKFSPLFLTLASEPSLSAVQNFFRFEDNELSWNCRIRNLPRHFGERSNNEKVAANFLLDFARLIWEGREDRNLVSAQTDAVRTWTIEILNELDRLPLLLELGVELNDHCLKTLKTIALRSRLESSKNLVKESRPVRSIGEAVLNCNQAAQVLALYQISSVERKNLKKILELERTRDSADRQLSGIARQKQ
jgi:hypothetical protein